ncbi:MAG: alpha/beta hydrolase [Thermomicrobiales bacterium]
MTATPRWRQSERALYGLGKTTMYACQYDQRFSYCLYVPLDHDEATEPYPIAVIVHGTNRPAQEYRDAFAEFAEAHKCVVLSPLFPAGIPDRGNLNNYKFIKHGGIRFDHVLLAMLDEVAETYNVDKERFLLHGFSGGGHFAHRFLYLHPDRLLGVSIGAPGVVTLLDDEHDWWVGVRNLEEEFGIAPDLDAMRQVPVLMVIGGNDTETWEITLKPGHRLWMKGADLAGANRLQRVESLKASFERHGIAVRHEVVPGVGHEGYKILDVVRNFFAESLVRYRAVEQAAPLTAN